MNIMLDQSLNTFIAQGLRFIRISYSAALLSVDLLLCFLITHKNSDAAVTLSHDNTVEEESSIHSIRNPKILMLPSSLA